MGTRSRTGHRPHPDGVGEGSREAGVSVLEIIDQAETPTGPTGSTGWMDVASCAGHSDLFFAPFAERPEARVRREAAARVICDGCEGLHECREYARTNRELGFWGGERVRARRGRVPSDHPHHRSQARRRTARPRRDGQRILSPVGVRMVP
ncbi:MAG: WhiB family transcriptional regulator [Acidimicrobiales bacterium]